VAPLHPVAFVGITLSAVGVLSAVPVFYTIPAAFPVFPNIGPKTVADLLESIEAAKANLRAENVAFLTG
jgi:hypothetical protein